MEHEKIGDFLQEQRDEAPEDLQHYFLSFEDSWERKLWHELTNQLVEFFAEPESAPQRIPIFNNFIKSFADKINQLKLVTIGLGTASQYRGWFTWFEMMINYQGTCSYICYS
jgi:26S proteasome regulatory subunit N9